MKKEAVALFAIPNIQNYTVLAALGYGLWTYGDTGIIRSGTVRNFTRKSAVEFLDNNGVNIKDVYECIDPLYTQQNQHQHPYKGQHLSALIKHLTTIITQ